MDLRKAWKSVKREIRMALGGRDYEKEWEERDIAEQEAIAMKEEDAVEIRSYPRTSDAISHEVFLFRCGYWPMWKLGGKA